MTEITPQPPASCQNMAELRVQIDSLDQAILELLVVRAKYIERAIELKTQEKLPARIADRVNEVIENVRAGAEQRGLDPDLAEKVWTELIEWAIAREETVLG